MIWVDTDGCVSAPQYCPVFLTSVIKNLTDSVTKYVTAAAGGTFPTGSYIGTLANKGTGLAPFHDFDVQGAGRPAGRARPRSQVTSSAGKIAITSPSQPK